MDNIAASALKLQAKNQTILVGIWPISAKSTKNLKLRFVRTYSAAARFSALKTARTDASSMFVSTPAPQREPPEASLIWI